MKLAWIVGLVGLAAVAQAQSTVPLNPGQQVVVTCGSVVPTATPSATLTSTPSPKPTPSSTPTPAFAVFTGINLPTFPPWTVGANRTPYWCIGSANPNFSTLTANVVATVDGVIQLNPNHNLPPTTPTAVYRLGGQPISSQLCGGYFEYVPTHAGLTDFSFTAKDDNGTVLDVQHRFVTIQAQ